MKTLRIGFVLAILTIVYLILNWPITINNQVVKHIRSVSVTIHYDKYCGSGTIFHVKNHNFIVTCAHVVEKAKTKDGFEQILVSQDIIDKNRLAGRQMFYADVVRYSDFEDIAILELKTSAKMTDDVDFQINPPDLGEYVIGCGSYLGLTCAHSISVGNYSAYGRIMDNTYFDQITICVHPGMSGGGLFSKTGSYLGIAVRKEKEEICYIVPSRRLYEYLKRTGFEFLIDSSIPVPECIKLVVE